MQIQINTDGNIKGREKMLERVSSSVQSAMLRFRDHLSRVEVHLSDEIGDKKGQGGKTCMMEARIAGRPPVAVTHRAATLEEAVDTALDKLTNLVANTLEKQRTQHHRGTNSAIPKSTILPLLLVLLSSEPACSEQNSSGSSDATSESDSKTADFDKAAKIFKFAADTYTYEKRAQFLQEMSNALQETRSDLDVLLSKSNDLIGMTRIETRRKLRELTDRTINLKARSDAAIDVEEPSWRTTRDGLSNDFTELMSTFDNFRRSMR